jgi:hypothetical protein
LSRIANSTSEGSRRSRANGNRFTVGDCGRNAQRELAVSQSAALPFAKECLTVTSDESDAVPLAVVYAAYEHWEFNVDGMSGREKRNKTNFRTDRMAGPPGALKQCEQNGAATCSQRQIF